MHAEVTKGAYIFIVKHCRQSTLEQELFNVLSNGNIDMKSSYRKTGRAEGAGDTAMKGRDGASVHVAKRPAELCRRASWTGTRAKITAGPV